MARYKDVEGYRKLFDEEYKKTRKLISEGETHLDNLAEGFSEASRVIDCLPTADVAPKSEVEELLMRLTHAYEKVDMAEDEVERLEQDVTRLEQENEALKDSNEHLVVLLAESKSEVAIEIIQDIAKACAPHNHHLNSLDFEIGYITAMNQVLAQLEEIKKKYTEEGGLYAMC